MKVWKSRQTDSLTKLVTVYLTSPAIWLWE